MTPDVAEGPVLGQTQFQSSPSSLEHVGSIATGAGFTLTAAFSGTRALLKEVGEEIASTVSGGLTDISKALKNLPNMVKNLKASKSLVELSRAQTKRITKIQEIAHNWNVRNTLSGELLDSGHITKIQDGIEGLTKHSQALQNSLNNPNLNSATRKAIQEAIDSANDLINKGNSLIK